MGRLARRGKESFSVRILAILLIMATALCFHHAPGRAGNESGDWESLVVNIDSGQVVGFREEGVLCWKGIPFAEPPVGDLRWKPPQAVKPWKGARKCTEYGPWCPQPKQKLIRAEQGRMSEDCLYLNIWAPPRNKDRKLPVMLWIHGGGCTTGSGSALLYDGKNLARQGIVVVTINYRVGPFGFLAHPLLSKESEKGVSGNYGMLDQIFALKWVRKNISAFGGDPGCVTIFGESAGSASVCRLMISPLSKGLFHRAIAESGGVHGRNRHLRERWYDMEPMEEVGVEVAKALKCDRSRDPIAALRSKSAEEILTASKPAQGLFGGFFGEGTKYGWVVDGWVIPDDPARLFEKGRFHDVPFLTGSNADEGTIFLQQLPIKGSSGYKTWIRSSFGKDADALLKLFPPDNKDIKVTLNRLTTVWGFAAPARAMTRAITRRKGKSYLYQLTRIPDWAEKTNIDCFHGLDIFYVFGNLPQNYKWDKKDHKISEIMSAYWVQFAKIGDPNNKSLTKWPLYTLENDEHMSFGDSVRSDSRLYRRESDLFEEIQKERLSD